MAPPCDIALFAAFHPELAPLRGALGDSMRGRVGNVYVTARVVGIGVPMAATGAAMHLADLRPRAAVAIGTCGAYVGRGLHVGDVVVSRRVRLVDPGALRGLAEFPEPMSVMTDAHAGLVDGILRATRAKEADVATPLAITVDDDVAGQIAAATGATAEHLEAHAVATACAARGVPFCAVLGVANFVGGRAREEWRRHHHEAAFGAAEVVLQWLQGDGFQRLALSAR